MKYIKIQSISDIITNSSSEVFICSVNGNSEKVAEEVEQFLKDIMDITEYTGDCFYTGATVTVAQDDGEIRGWDYTYNKGDILIESVDDNSIPYSIMCILEDLPWIPKFDGKITNVDKHHLG